MKLGRSARLVLDVFIDPGGASDAKALDKLEKLPTDLRKTFDGKLQEAYIAEDDFWKITTLGIREK